MDNFYPEEIVPLRNPKKSLPQVPMEVMKLIFPPDDDKPHDGEKVVRSDEVWAPCHVFLGGAWWAWGIALARYC